jgi:DNA-binding MarR family transcriptional regulator
VSEIKKRAQERRMIGALLRVPFYAVVNQIYQQVVAAGFDDLRPAHLVVFQNIDLDGSRLTELADRALMTKQSMGYLVDYLEEHGYLERVPDPHDGRARIVQLTERGWNFQRTTYEAVANLEQHWTDVLGSERMDLLIGLLMELVAKVGDEPTSDYVPRMRELSTSRTAEAAKPGANGRTEAKA